MTRTKMPRHLALFLLVLFTLVLGSCTFTYIPLVRTPNPVTPRLLVGESSHLVEKETTLELVLQLETVPEPDWLAVQWFSPANEEVDATSLWLEPAAKVQRITTALSPEVELSEGLWRAVISYRGVLERQFSITVGPR